MSDSSLPSKNYTMDAASMNANNEVPVTRTEETESKEMDLDKNPLQGVIFPTYHPQFASSTISDNYDSLIIQNYGISCRLTCAVNTTYVHVAPIQKHEANSEMYHQCSFNNKMATALIPYNEKAIDVTSVNANNERLLSSTRGEESNSMQVDENRNVKNFFCIYLGIILICIIIVAIYFIFIFFVTC